MLFHCKYSKIRRGDYFMIADRIRQAREQNKMTQAELAKYLGITRASVNAWEQGISAPSTPYLVELAKLFKVSTDYLLGMKSFSVISTDGLTEEDIEIVYGLVQHLRNINNS